MLEPRRFLRDLFEAAIAAADPAVSCRRICPSRRAAARSSSAPARRRRRWACALERHWPGELSGLIVTRYGHGAPCERIEVVEAAHPVPDEAGRAAAERILELVARARPRTIWSSR